MGEECLHPLEGLELRGDQTLHCRCGAEFFCHSMAFMKVVRRALAPRPRAKIHDWKNRLRHNIHPIGPGELPPPQGLPESAHFRVIGDNEFYSWWATAEDLEAFYRPKFESRLESRLEALEKRSHRFEAQLATFRQEVQGRSFRASRDPLESRLAGAEERVTKLSRRVAALDDVGCRHCGEGSQAHLRGGVCPGGVGFYEE